MGLNAGMFAFAVIILISLAAVVLLPSVFELYATRQPWRYEEWCPGVYGEERCERERYPLQWEFSEFQ